MAKFGMRVNMLQDSLETPTLSHIKQLTLVEYLSFNMAERKSSHAAPLDGSSSAAWEVGAQITQKNFTFPTSLALMPAQPMPRRRAYSLGASSVETRRALALVKHLVSSPVIETFE